MESMFLIVYQDAKSCIVRLCWHPVTSRVNAAVGPFTLGFNCKIISPFIVHHWSEPKVRRRKYVVQAILPLRYLAGSDRDMMTLILHSTFVA